mmetsp:Transcript_19954/g.31621  ORF Transcript_19954/g.31621 Transcript_19954/m.31621 type:complete len:262 (+) Transcript_19954:1543-2328(+)
MMFWFNRHWTPVMYIVPVLLAVTLSATVENDLGAMLRSISVLVKWSSSSSSEQVTGFLPSIEISLINRMDDIFNCEWRGFSSWSMTFTGSPMRANRSSGFALAARLALSIRGLLTISSLSESGTAANSTELQASDDISADMVQPTSRITFTSLSRTRGRLSLGTGIPPSPALSTRVLRSEKKIACRSGGCSCCGPALTYLIICFSLAKRIFSSAGEYSSMSFCFWSPVTKGLGLATKSKLEEKNLRASFVSLSWERCFARS